MEVPPPDGDQNQGPKVLALVWTQTVVAILFLAARFYARLVIRKISIDDWLMLLTLSIFIASAVVTTIQVEAGGYRHIYYLTDKQIVVSGEMNFILRALAILSYVAGKAAVGSLILRIMGPQASWRRWLVWVVMIFTAIINILNCIFNFVQCDPIQANWTPGIPAKCWNPDVQTDFAYFMSSENVLADVILALLPMVIVSKLHMSLRKRINLSLLLGLGLLAAICGIVKITTLKSIDAGPDLTWDTYALTVWSLSETFVIIVCGCVPPLKVLWDRFFVRKKHSEAAAYSYNTQTRDGFPKRSGAKPTSSMPNQTDYLVLGDDREFRGNGIRKTTEIKMIDI